MGHGENLQSLLRAGSQRLYPRITNPNWLVLRRRREIFRAWCSELARPRLRILDVGGHIQPYRELLPRPHEYWSVDLRPGLLVGVIADATLLPFAADTFDIVLSTQMLEYAPDPAGVVKEIHRVLRPKGVLLLSAPSIFPRDSEHDAWRFFPSALSSLLSIFTEHVIVAECGSAAGFLRTAAVFGYATARFRVLQWLLSVSLVPVFNLTGFVLDRLGGNREGSFTPN